MACDALPCGAVWDFAVNQHNGLGGYLWKHHEKKDFRR